MNQWQSLLNVTSRGQCLPTAARAGRSPAERCLVFELRLHDGVVFVFEIQQHGPELLILTQICERVNERTLAVTHLSNWKTTGADEIDEYFCLTFVFPRNSIRGNKTWWRRKYWLQELKDSAKMRLCVLITSEEERQSKRKGEWRRKGRKLIGQIKNNNKNKKEVDEKMERNKTRDWKNNKT